MQKLPAKRRFLYSFHSFLQISGVASCYVKVAGCGGTTILMYHSVAEEKAARWIDPDNHMRPELFRKQMAYLKRNRHVVSINELLNSLMTGESLPAGSVVITIDDGYLDTLTIAAPILQEYDLPAVLYLATGYISREENQWIDQLFSLFRYRTKNHIILPRESEKQDLDLSIDLSAAYRAVSRQCLQLSYENRRDLLADISGQLRPSEIAPRLTLSWDEVRSFRQKYPDIAIGGHTRNHIDLTSVSLESAEEEIATCSRDITDAIGEVAQHFSYPYNRFLPELEPLLWKNGFLTGVASGADMLITSDASRYFLPRIEAPDSIPRLGFYSSGAYPSLSRMLTGRA